MTNEEKLHAILSLLTDQNVYDLFDEGTLKTDEERFGAMVFASDAFSKAYKIMKDIK